MQDCVCAQERPDRAPVSHLWLTLRSHAGEGQDGHVDCLNAEGAPNHALSSSAKGRSHIGSEH